MQDEAGTEEASNRVDRDDESLPCFVSPVLVDFREAIDEGVGGDDSRHDTLVITEEQEVGSRNGGDEHLEPSA